MVTKSRNISLTEYK